MPSRRVFVTGEQARPVVAALTRLRERHGSVNALAHELNVLLAAAGRRQTIYPNCIYALLSGDPEKSVNPAVFRLIEAAVTMLDAQGSEVAEIVDMGYQAEQAVDARVDALLERVETLEREVAILKRGGCTCSEPQWYYANLLMVHRCGRCGAVASPGYGADERGQL